MTLPAVEVTVRPDLDGDWELVSEKAGLLPIHLRVTIHSDDLTALITFVRHADQQETYHMRCEGIVRP